MGWKGVVVSIAERTLCINEANLSVNQNGSGTPGRVGAFYMPHQNATKASSPSGVSHRVTLGQVCVSTHTQTHTQARACCAFCSVVPLFPVCIVSDLIFSSMQSFQNKLFLIADVYLLIAHNKEFIFFS